MQYLLVLVLMVTFCGCVTRPLVNTPIGKPIPPGATLYGNR